MIYRALIAKAGLDAHERGVHVVTRGLRDAGFEVIYLGLRVKPAGLVNVVVQEDVQVLGVSSLAGGHRRFATNLRLALDRAGADPVVVFGGVIPEEDDDYLAEQGVQAVFRSGTLMSEIVGTIRGLCDSHVNR